MTICSDGHGELCYEGNDCPACEIVQEREDALEELKEANKSIESLETQITELENGEDS